MTYKKIISLLRPVLKQFRCRPVMLLGNRKKNEYWIGGSFDTEATRQPIEIEISFPAKYETIKLNRKRWKEFLFVVMQVLHHESIHFSQVSYRVDTTSSRGFHLDDDAPMTESQEYLAQLDEIEAYASDIVLEILNYYPKIDPFVALNDLTKYNVWSYDYYKKTFENSQWSSIRQQLLKKTYSWMVHYIDEGIWTYAK